MVETLEEARLEIRKLQDRLVAMDQEMERQQGVAYHDHVAWIPVNGKLRKVSILSHKMFYSGYNYDYHIGQEVVEYQKQMNSGVRIQLEGVFFDGID